MYDVITDEEARQNIAANLSKIMTARGMSQKELAKLTGRPIMTINRLCRGTREPKVSLIAAVAEALGFSIEAMLAPPANGRESGRAEKSLISA